MWNKVSPCSAGLPEIHFRQSYPQIQKDLPTFLFQIMEHAMAF